MESLQWDDSLSLEKSFRKYKGFFQSSIIVAEKEEMKTQSFEYGMMEHLL